MKVYLTLFTIKIKLEIVFNSVYHFIKRLAILKAASCRTTPTYVLTCLDLYVVTENAHIIQLDLPTSFLCNRRLIKLIY